jgi:hypothetical protein
MIALNTPKCVEQGCSKTSLAGQSNVRLFDLAL